MKKLLLHSMLLLACAYGNGQDAVRNTGNLQIHTGASMNIDGNFTNASTSALVNDGSLYASRTVTNDQASMSAGTGTLYLNGASAQAVNGTQAFRTFNLNSNNAAGITLNNNLSVSGAHTFTSGIITTSATPNYLVYESGSSYSGDGDARHVNGWVKNIGSTNFTFPVGNGTIERTVALSSLSASSEFNARYLANTPNQLSLVIPLRDVDDLEYWAINRVSGGTAIVNMNWDYSKVYFPNWIVPDIVAAGYNGSAWTDNGGSASGNPATTGTVTSGTISSFNLFTIGSRSWVLPLTLTHFTAKRQDNYTKIEWATEKELNVRHFIVERSDNGSSFYQVARQDARNSGATEQYTAKDYAPIQYIAYYRLRSVDHDGKESFSRIVAVTDKQGGELLLLTNPVRHQITLVATSQLSGDFRYQLSAINGQLVQQGKLFIISGGQYQIPLNSTIQHGTYSLKVISGEREFYYKLIVQ